MSVNDNSMFRKDLIAQSIEKIEMNFIRATERGDVDPIVLLLHLPDEFARLIAEQFDHTDRIASMLSDARREVSPAVIIGLPSRAACRIADGFFWDREETIDAIDAGQGFIVVAVARGGATVMTLPPVAA